MKIVRMAKMRKMNSQAPAPYKQQYTNTTKQQHSSTSTSNKAAQQQLGHHTRLTAPPGSADLEGMFYLRDGASWTTCAIYSAGVTRGR